MDGFSVAQNYQTTLGDYRKEYIENLMDDNEKKE